MYVGLKMGRKWLTCMGVSFVLFGTVIPIQAETYNDMYERIFGTRPKNEPVKQTMVLIMDDRVISHSYEVMVPTIGNDYQVSAYPILAYIRTVQLTGTAKDVAMAINKNGRISVDKLNQLGYKTDVNRRDFTVTIDIPSNRRKTIALYVQPRHDSRMNNTMYNEQEPARISSYTNIGFMTNYRRSTAEDAQNGWENPTISFSGKTRTGDLVVNHAGYIDADSPTGGSIRHLNVLKVFNKSNQEWVFGQVLPRTTGMMSSPSLLGIGYTSGPILDPIGDYTPEYTHPMVIDEKSRLTIVINGERVKEFFLEPGRYELKQFPLRTGYNSIQMIKDTQYPPFEHGEFNQLDDGALLKVYPKKNESRLIKAQRFHYARQFTSDMFLSTKLPTRNTGYDYYFSPTQNIYRTTEAISIAHDPGLLDPIYSEFHIASGVPMVWEGTQIKTTDAHTVSMAYKRGLNRTITAGLYTQLNNAHQLVGSNIRWVNPFGAFHIDSALTYTEGLHSPGRSFGLIYASLPSRTPQDHPLRLNYYGAGATLRTADFLPFGVIRPMPNDNSLLQLYAHVSMDIMNWLAASVQLSETMALSGNTSGDTHQVSVGLQPRISDQLFANIMFVKRRGETIMDSETVSFRLSWTGIDALSTSIGYKQTETTNDGVLSAQYEQEFYDGQLETVASTEISKNNQMVGASMSYRDHVFGYTYRHAPNQMDHQFRYGIHNQRVNATTSFLHQHTDNAGMEYAMFSAETAIVMADFNIGLSTPIQDSFALFTKDDSLKDFDVYIGEDGLTIHSFGGAVLPSLTDRVISNVSIDAPNLPIGYELNRLVAFRPTHFTGYLVPLHATPSILAVGILEDSQFNRMPYTRGFITSEQQGVSVPFMTSRTGMFQLPNVTPGAYILSINNQQFRQVRIDIPESANGLYRLGVLSLQSRPDGEPPYVPLLSKKMNAEREPVTIKKDRSSVNINDLIEEIMNEMPEISDQTPYNHASKPVATTMRHAIAPIIATRNHRVRTEKKAQYIHQLNQAINREFPLPRPPQLGVDSLSLSMDLSSWYLSSLGWMDAMERMDAMDFLNGSLHDMVHHGLQGYDARQWHYRQKSRQFDAVINQHKASINQQMVTRQYSTESTATVDIEDTARALHAMGAHRDAKEADQATRTSMHAARMRQLHHSESGKRAIDMHVERQYPAD